MTCKACGVRASKGNLCVLCSIWERRANDNRSRFQARIDGKLYIIRPETQSTRLSENSKKYEHYIIFKNGRKIYSTNLSCAGEIPTYFSKRMPDNAAFSKPWGKKVDEDHTDDG